VLSRALPFFASSDASFFAELPASAAVFLLRGDGEPYVSKTANLRRRMQRLLGPPAESSKRLNLRDRVREIEFTSCGSDFESQFLLYELLRQNFPKTYAARLRLRPAALVKLHLENEYPRASVTTRLGKIEYVDPDRVTDREETGENVRVSKIQSGNLYYGPFPSRAAAEKFASDALDFFKMRRCVDDLHPDPAFPGCVYSEMKMCLAPCFKGCTDSDYRAEVARVQAFFDSGGDSLSRELATQREEASARLAFEEAAALHAKIEKLKSLLAQLPEIVRRIDRLCGLIIQPSAEPASVSFFHVSAGCMSGPVAFSVALPPGPGSMESRVEEMIRGIVPEAKSSLARTEHLAILKRWYYRSHRAGEVFFRDEKGVWPLRRIVRGIGRVYRGETAGAPAAPAAMQPVPPG
jgi:excinuclease UvrABC nuclease subunit